LPTSPPESRLLGAERPRVELRPPPAASLAGPAIELAQRAGLVLEQWQCEGLELMLSVRPDGRWACPEYVELVPRQAGKTEGLGVPRALAGLYLLGERLIMWSAHEYKTAMESFLRVREYVENLVDLGLVDPPKVHNTNGEEGFRLPSGQRLKFLARSKGSGRGFSGDCNIIDEAYAYTRAQQSALMPTMSARPNWQMCYLSSPPLDGESGEPLYSLRDRAAEQEQSLGYRDWGLGVPLEDLIRMPSDDRKAFLDDRSNWAAANPAFGRGRVTEESIESMRRSMSDLDFAREFLGMWPTRINRENGWLVIREPVWRARGGAEDRPDGPVVFAVAAEYPDAERASIGVAGFRERELLVQVVDHHEGTSWAVARLRELRDAHGPLAVILDKRGPARHLLPALEAAGVEVFCPSMEEVQQAAAMFFAAFAGDEPTGRHYNQRELDAALASATKRPLADGWTWDRKGATGISPVEAVTLAAWGVIVRADNERAPNLW
jgi:hypothetical protein